MDWHPFVFATIAVVIVAYGTVWVKNKLGPAKKLAMQNESPLIDLKRAGFVATTTIDVGDGSEPDQAVGYVGQIDGYAVEISYNFLWGVLAKSPYFRIRVFFNPGATEPATLNARLVQNIARSKLFRWSGTEKLTDTYAETIVDDGKFGHPPTQALLDVMQRLIHELRRLNLPPISYGDGIVLTQKAV